jgi:hypothetical protein
MLAPPKAVPTIVRGGEGVNEKVRILIQEDI